MSQTSIFSLIKMPLPECPSEPLGLSDRLFISFSGGRTSAFMAYFLLRNLPSHTDARVVFANTGQEHEATLEFVDKCDRHLGFNTVWIEAKTALEKGRGQQANVVDFRTASRDGKPFEGMIRKHGIPNRMMPHCTRELKERPLKAYLRSIGWKAGLYQTAIGIRVDEIDRMNPHAIGRKIIYPLVKWRITKDMVLDFWRQQPFDLAIPEHLGNCTWCWKKSLRKHLTIARDYPECFEFPRRMEKLYPLNGPSKTGEPKRFFRGDRTADEIIELSKQPFDAFEDPNFDLNFGCGESCEVFT